MVTARRPLDAVHRPRATLRAKSAGKRPRAAIDVVDCIPEIVLEGRRGTLILDPAAWIEFLDLAHENGWTPAHLWSDYRPGRGTEISAHEAYEMARTLRNVVERLILCETSSTRPDLPELISDLSELIAFCCDSGFRIP